MRSLLRNKPHSPTLLARRMADTVKAVLMEGP